MAGTFFGLTIAQSGLTAQQRAMEVMGYNISHANDTNYKRQKVVAVEGAVLATSQEAGTTGTTQTGSGVQSGDVQRVVDNLVETRLRIANSGASQWDYMSTTMTEIESAVDEPSDSGLESSIDDFWDSWDSVATSPDETDARNDLIQKTDTMCQQMQYVYSELKDIKTDVNKAISADADQINLIANEISQLNSQIGSLQSGQMPVNDLLNKRDGLVTDLAKIVSINQTGEDPQSFIISIGGRVLVQGTNVTEVKSVTDTSGNSNIQWSDDGTSVQIDSGELAAMTDLRDNKIPGYLSSLDNLATTLVSEVNTLHKTGTDLDGNAGGDFFKEGTTAANIALDDGVADDPNKIAAASDGSSGGGTVASEIADLKETGSANTIYNNFVTTVGTDTSVASTQLSAHNLTVTQYQSQEQSISGVSLDEELTNMIKFQQAYSASAKVLTAMDSMLTTLMNIQAS